MDMLTNNKVKNNKDCIYCSLTFAILNNDLEKVKAIVESDIDLNQKTDCNSALYYAIEENNVELVELLITKGANPNLKFDYKELPIVQAIKNRNERIIELLISLGATFDDFPIDNFVGGSDNPELIEFILDAGLDVNFKEKKTGRNSLHYAAMYGYEKISQLLLKRKINYDLTDNWGNAPADLAQINGHHIIVSIIRKYKAAHNVKK